MLDGTNPAADARLIADIDAADPFDGGCAADVEPRTSVQAKLIERDADAKRRREQSDAAYSESLESLTKSARERGARMAINWLNENGYTDAAVHLYLAVDNGEVLK